MSVWFDASNLEYLKAASTSLLSGLGAMSTAIWVYPDTLNLYSYYLNAWYITTTADPHPQAMFLGNGDQLRGWVRTGVTNYGGNFGCTLTTGSWQHVAMTYDGSTLIGYRNAVAGGTTYSPSGNIATDSNELQLGRGWYSTDPTRFFDGNCEDRGIWDRALSAEEIADMYNHKLRCGFFPSGLIQWWPLSVKGDNFPVSTYTCENDDYGLQDLVGILPATIGTAPSFDIGRDPLLNWPS